MPVRNAAKEHLLTSNSHQELTPATKFPCLCDLYRIKFTKTKTIYLSIGDLFCYVGALGLFSIIFIAVLKVSLAIR